MEKYLKTFKNYMVKLSIHNLLKLLLPLLLIYGSKQCYADTVSIPLRYYHSDHLGSASWITNGSGTPIQHLQYMPYGEPFVNERTSSYEERFTLREKKGIAKRDIVTSEQDSMIRI